MKTAKTMTRSEKIAFNKAEKRIEQAYYATCSGIQINMLDISKVFAEGHRLLALGVSEDELRAGVRAFVETIRKN